MYIIMFYVIYEKRKQIHIKFAKEILYTIVGEHEFYIYTLYIKCKRFIIIAKNI